MFSDISSNLLRRIAVGDSVAGAKGSWLASALLRTGCSLDASLKSLFGVSLLECEKFKRWQSINSMLFPLLNGYVKLIHTDWFWGVGGRWLLFLMYFCLVAAATCVLLKPSPSVRGRS